MTVPFPHTARRVRWAATCGLLAMAAVGCKRQPPGAASEPGAAAPAREVPPVVMVDAADLPDPSAPPLRVVFGERGKGVAYVTARADGAHVVHNGRAGRAVGAVDQVAISPDGARIAYGTQVDGSWRMVVDERLEVMSSSVGDPAFSPDSRHVAYDARTAEGKRLVIDAVPGPVRLQFVGGPSFSGDSALVAFAEIVAEGEPARLVVSDLSLARQRVVCEGVERFVADDAETTIAAVVREGDRQRVVTTPFALNGDVTRGPPYDAIASLAFASGGASVAYVAESGDKRLLVAGGKERELAFEEVGDVAFGGGELLAFCARRGDAWFVVSNGKEGPAFDRVVSPAFSPDGRRLAYRARKNGKRFVVIADRAGNTLRQLPPYEQVFPVHFAADGKSIAYGVKDGRELAWKVEPL